jgi:hypothetical protein
MGVREGSNGSCRLRAAGPAAIPATGGDDPRADKQRDAAARPAGTVNHPSQPRAGACPADMQQGVPDAGAGRACGTFSRPGLFRGLTRLPQERAGKYRRQSPRARERARSASPSARALAPLSRPGQAAPSGSRRSSAGSRITARNRRGCSCGVSDGSRACRHRSRKPRWLVARTYEEPGRRCRAFCSPSGYSARGTLENSLSVPGSASWIPAPATQLISEAPLQAPGRGRYGSWITCRFPPRTGRRCRQGCGHGR